MSRCFLAESDLPPTKVGRLDRPLGTGRLLPFSMTYGVVVTVAIGVVNILWCSDPENNCRSRAMLDGVDTDG